MDDQGRKSTAEISSLAVVAVTRMFSEKENNLVGANLTYAWDEMGGDNEFVLIERALDQLLEDLSKFGYSVKVWSTGPDPLCISRIQLLITPAYNISGWSKAPR